MATLVPANLAEWLRSENLVETATAAGVAAAWGDLAIDSELQSPFAEQADAAAEAARQLTFLGVALAVEKLLVRGWHANLIGQSRRVAANADGYAGTPPVFIIGADEQEGGVTVLTVLRKVEAV